MAVKDLREFMALLEKKGQLKRVAAELDPVLEIGEVTDRVSKAVGPALLFENPVDRETGRRYTIPVAINLMGSYDRMAWAMGVDAETGTWKDLDAVGKRLMDLLPLDMPASMKGKLDVLMGLKDLATAGAKEVKKAPCQEVVLRGEDVDLGILPVLKTWPEDGGRFITLPLVVTANLKGKLNVGMYRMQVFDKNTTGMHIHEHHDGAKNLREQFAAGATRVPVSVALGADPVTIFAATAPVPPIIDEYLFAGIVRGEPVEVIKCVTNDLMVPAHAEIVLEGYVEAGETRWEGPFGDHTGYYSLADQYPVFHLTAMSHRRDPVYPATIVGKPPMEDAYLGKATERLFLPLLQLVQPEIVDMDLPIEGVFHDCAIISIRKEYPGHARKIMNAVWGMGQMMFTKFVVVVDEHVDVHDYSEVTWRAFNNVDPARDCVVAHGPLDVLDHSSPLARYGAKMGIDATKTWPEEGHDREWPDELAMDPGVVLRVDERWAEFGLPFG